MKKIKLTIILTLLIITIPTYSQTTDFKQLIRLETGLGFNFCKNKVDERYSYGLPDVKAVPLSRPGYNFYSNASILLYKRWRVNAGLDITLLNHSFRGYYQEYETFILFYQLAMETPVSISYDFLNINDHVLSIEAGLKYTSLMNIPGDPGEGFVNNYDFSASLSADIFASNKWAVMSNAASFMRLSYLMPLKNKDYIRFFINYLQYASGMEYYIAHYYVTDPNHQDVGGGYIRGYYGNVSIGAYYSFSFRRHYEKIYRRGIEAGRNEN